MAGLVLDVQQGGRGRVLVVQAVACSVMLCFRSSFSHARALYPYRRSYVADISSSFVPHDTNNIDNVSCGQRVFAFLLFFAENDTAQCYVYYNDGTFY